MVFPSLTFMLFQFTWFEAFNSGVVFDQYFLFDLINTFDTMSENSSHETSLDLDSCFDHHLGLISRP